MMAEATSAAGPLTIVGERINSSRPPIAQALEERNSAFLQAEARKQVEAGAHYLDVNAATLMAAEEESLAWLVTTVQQAVAVPLCIDTPNAAALAAALKVHRGQALVNSISAEKTRYESFLPLIKEYQPLVVALCLDDAGIPGTMEGRVAIAERLRDKLVAEGIPQESLYFDPLIQPISAEPEAARLALETMIRLKQRLPGVRLICGASNVSFGLPSRRQLNRTFIALAMQSGLDAALIDPLDRQVVASILAASALLGRDQYCRNYLKAHRQGRLAP